MSRIYFISVLSILILNFTISTGLHDEHLIKKLYNELDNGKQAEFKRYLIFELNRAEIRDNDYFIRIVKDFFLSNGIQSVVYNVKDEIFIAAFHRDQAKDININTIKSYFDKAFIDIKWHKNKYNS